MSLVRFVEVGLYMYCFCIVFGIIALDRHNTQYSEQLTPTCNQFPTNLLRVIIRQPEGAKYKIYIGSAWTGTEEDSNQFYTATSLHPN